MAHTFLKVRKGTILPARQIGGVAEAVEYTVEFVFFFSVTRLNELIGRCVSKNPPDYGKKKLVKLRCNQHFKRKKDE